MDEGGHDAAKRLQTKTQWGHIQQQDIVDITGQHTCLQGRAQGYYLVRVDTLVWLLAGQLLDHLLNHGHPGGAAYQDDRIQVAGLQVRIGQGLLKRGLQPGYQVLGQLLELGPAQGHL